MREKQILRQEGATGSTNAQAGRDLVVVQGFSPEDVQAVIREVITANALQMRDVAATVADERISHFAEKFIARASDEPELVQATGDPDMQQAVIEAGLGFARSGDEHLADVLLDLLTDRAKEPPRTLLALVINDAVTVAPRVTDGELAILTLYWRLVHTVSQRVTTLDSLSAFVHGEIAPLVSAVPRGDASYLHLQSLGCAFVQITSVPFEQIWLSTYRGLFTTGFLQEDITTDLWQQLDESSLLIPCLRDASRWQIAALNEHYLREHLLGAPLEPRTEAIVELFNRSAMSPDEVLKALADIEPIMSEFAQLWSSTPLCSLRLSAVGMAIAHAHWRRMTGQETPLSIWISEAERS